jgi:hypothetical protein
MPGALNGIDVLAATIILPRIGVWWADVELDTDDALAGAAILEYAWSLAGTVADGGQSVHGRNPVRVVGGRGRLGDDAPAKTFRGVPIRLPIVDTVEGAGEVVSATATWGLSMVLAHWIRTRRQAAQAVMMLARKGGFAWRFLPDGTFWFGEETWPEADIEHEVMEELPRENAVLIATDELLLPGTTLLGQRVGRVQMRPHESRTTVWFER